MKILLIKPMTSVWRKSQASTPPTAKPPVGLAYIASYLRKNGYQDIRILDGYKGGPGREEDDRVTFGMPMAELLKEVESFKPDVVGISCLYTCYYYDSVLVAQGVKQLFPGVPVILGGSHASTFPREMAQLPCIDLVVKGEGEIVFLEIVRRLEKKEPLTGIPSTALRVGGEYQEQPFKLMVKDLDEYPMPAYDLMDMPSYIAGLERGWCREFPVVGIISSRGCPNGCTYCSVATLFGRGWRHHSAARVADEIEFLQKTYGYREVAFMDDSISANPKHLEALCDEFLRRGLDFSWSLPNGIAHWTLTKPLLDKMKKAGCYRLTFGIESGNPEIRKFIGKGHASLEQATELLRYANAIGLWTICTFILGFPQETKEQMMDTIRYSADCDTDFAVFYRLVFFPKTPVYEYARGRGILNYDHLMDPAVKNSWVELFEVTNTGCFPEDGKLSLYYTNREINEMVFLGHQYFFRRRLISFLNPLRLARKLSGPKSLGYAWYLFKKGLVLVWRFIDNRGKFNFNMLHGNPKREGNN